MNEEKPPKPLLPSKLRSLAYDSGECSDFPLIRGTQGVSERTLARKLLRIPSAIAQLLILAYQKTISFDHGPLARFFSHPVCRFHPTCSEYGHTAFGRYGFLKGGWMTTKRIGRCHPWQKGGADPVPEKK